MHDKWEKRDHTRWRTQGLGQKSSGEGEEVEWEVFGRKKRVFLSREYDKSQESYCRLTMAHRVTQYSDSNYMPIEVRKNGSLTFCSRNWLWNIFPISRDPSSQN